MLNATLDNQRVTILPFLREFQPFDILSDEPKLRVYHGDNFVSIEMYHTLTDATGCLAFLNTLLAILVYKAYSLTLTAL